MPRRWFLPVITRFGTLILAGYIAWMGWQQLGPQKPEIGPVRKELADKAVVEIAEELRQNKGHIYDVVMMHFVNDPTDYFTLALRKEIEHRGILDLRDRRFFDKLRDKLNLRHPATDSSEGAAKIAKAMKSQAALIGTINTFESYPGGSTLKVIYQLVSADGRVVHVGQYIKESSDFALKPAMLQKKARSMVWFQRGLAWMVLVLLLPVFTISFIRSMVRRRSNGRNAFILGIYTVTDAVLAWFLVGASLAGFWSVLIFALAIIAALLYNVRIMTFAIKLEEE